MFNAIQKKTEEKEAKVLKAAVDKETGAHDARMKVLSALAIKVIGMMKETDVSLQEAQFVIQSCEQALKYHMGQLKLVDVVKE
jgi:hypothetical protein